MALLQKYRTRNWFFPRLLEKLSQILGKSWAYKWVKYYLLFMLFLAVFGSFIANERPLYCKIDGVHYFPVLKGELVDAGMAEWPKGLFAEAWDEYKYQRKLMPLIPYSAKSIDMRQMKVMSPFEKQNKDWRYRHWLGTDPLGRDVAAGLIRGTRIAFLVGIGAMLIASLIGLLLGLCAGYFGDKGIRMSKMSLVALILIFLSWLYFITTAKQISLIKGSGYFFLVFILVTGCHMLFFIGISSWSHNRLNHRRALSIPLDILVMRFIEIFKTIPALIFLLALLTLLVKPSIWSMILILGVLLWPSITRFTRAEMLKIREEKYITAARLLGMSHRHILINHALPNLIGPVLVVIAFGTSSAILLEATLSFLGLGLAFDDVSWGSMLKDAKQHFSAWWLAIFPGLAIFLTVASFNIIGDRIQHRLKEGEQPV